MRYWLLIVYGIIMFAAPALADPLVFTWDASPVEEQITGYRLYQGCGGPECIIAVLQPGATSYSMPPPNANTSFSLTAYRVDAEGVEDESLHSDYATFAYTRTRPTRPGNLKVTLTKGTK